MNALNPVRTVEQPLRRRAARPRARLRPRRRPRASAVELLDKVGLDPRACCGAYPHELSGGMRQRVAIALALALEPRLMVFDEPTTALDVLVQHAIMDTIKQLQRESGFTALLISHDLGVVLEADRPGARHVRRADRGGPAVGAAADRPHHPYTRGAAELLRRPASRARHAQRHPRLATGPAGCPAGCPFAPRCPLVEPGCRHAEPPLADGVRLLRARGPAS